ncbi:MAG TPA: RHS repeat-associated core domain-containing protein [Pyrinomonadaceae bacterium]
MRRANLFLAVALIVSAAVQLRGQSQQKNNARGFNANAAYSSHDFDHVNIFNGNLVVAIPLGRPYPVGGKLSYSFRLVYNSNIWSQQEACTGSTSDGGVNFNNHFYGLFGLTRWTYTSPYTNQTFSGYTTVGEPGSFIFGGGNDIPKLGPRATEEPCQVYNYINPASNAGIGWQLHFGKIFRPRNDVTDVQGAATERLRVIYQGADGSEHAFYGKLHETDPDSDPADIFYTRDGSYLRMWQNPNGDDAAYDGDAAAPYSYVVEFPNGEKHYFQRVAVQNGTVSIRGVPETLPYFEDKIVKIEDQFGNWVRIDYRDDSSDVDGLPDNLWEVTDSVGRAHRIEFVKHGSDALIQHVKLNAFNGATNTTTLAYDQKTTQLPSPHAPKGFIPGYNTGSEADGTADRQRVSYLTSVRLNDESQFSMPADTSYASDVEVVAAQTPGVLKKMGLPTGGAVEWEYETAETDETFGYYFSAASSARHYLRRSTGVRRRTLVENGRRHTWKYDPKLGPKPPECAPGAYQPPCGSKDITNRVELPTGDYSLHHFSVYPFLHPNTELRNSLELPHVVDYGLPFTKDKPHILDRKGLPLFLSTEVFDAAGNAKRRVYVRYETDKFVRDDGTGNTTDANARLVATRTVFEDDGGRFTEKQYENFDGLGHHRTVTSYSDFKTGDQRADITLYNPDRGVYLVNQISNQPDASASHTYTPFPADRPWVLDTYSAVIAGDYAKTSASFYNFDRRGLLLSKRVKKEFDDDADPVAGAATFRLTPNDIVVKYDYRESDGVTRGNLMAERTYGGDRQGGLGAAYTATASQAAADLAALTPTLADSASEYALLYSYPRCGGGTLGVVRAKQYSGVAFKSEDYDIDCRTGLVKVTRDSSGNATQYFYDELGRVTDVIAQEGANTKIRYTSVTGGATTGSPRVSLFRRAKDNFGTTGYLDQEEYVYDQLGRLTAEKQKAASGTFSTRYTTYNGLGWKTSISEWVADSTSTAGKKTTYDSYDPFGRPLSITLPDNKQITHGYVGARVVRRWVNVGTLRNSAGGVDEEASLTVRRYDQFGRLHQVVEPSGSAGQNVTTSYDYLVTGDLTSACTTSGGFTQCRTFGYDGRGFLRTESLPERPSSQRDDYDTLGNVGKTYDGVHRLRHSYDKASRSVSIEELVEATGVWRMLKEFSYYAMTSTAGGPFGGSKLAWATRHNWVRDPFNPTLTAEVDITVTEDYTYTGLDGLLGKRVTRARQPDGPAFEQTFDYDQLGDLVSQTYPKCVNAACAGSGAARPWRVKYSRANGMLTGVSGGVDNGAALANWTPTVTYSGSISYHANLSINTVAHGNGVSDVHAADPNSRPRVRRISTSGALNGAEWNSGDYLYDGDGNVKKIGADWYLYDKVGRLVEGTTLGEPNRSVMNQKKKYSYDAFGNILIAELYGGVTAASPAGTLTLRHTTGVSSSTNRYQNNYDGAGSLLGTFAYDAAGNFLGESGKAASLVFDAMNMVEWAEVSAGRGATYIYAPNDERLWVIDATNGAQNLTHTMTVRGARNEVLREYSVRGNYATSGNWSWAKDYVYRSDKLLSTEAPGRAPLHYHLDHLGTARLITDAAKAVVERPLHHPFGEPVTGSAERLQFTGHERDRAIYAPYYMHARYYSNGGNKFLSVDPGRDWDREQPQSWNAYAYVRNNPLKLTDPTGQWATALAPPENMCVPGQQFPTVFELWMQRFPADIRTGQTAELTARTETAPPRAPTPSRPQQPTQPWWMKFAGSEQFNQTAVDENVALYNSETVQTAKDWSALGPLMRKVLPDVDDEQLYPCQTSGSPPGTNAHREIIRDQLGGAIRSVIFKPFTEKLFPPATALNETAMEKALGHTPWVPLPDPVP